MDEVSERFKAEYLGHPILYECCEHCIRFCRQYKQYGHAEPCPHPGCQQEP